MCRWRRRLFGHIQYQVVFVNSHDAAFFELFVVRLIIAHYAGGLLGFRVVDEAVQTEIEQIVAGNYEQITVELQLFDCELYVLDRAETGFVSARSVVDDSDFIRLGLDPVIKVVRLFMVRYDYIFVYFTRQLYVVEQPVEYGLVAHL